jgi:Putative Zn-dependent protease, contains TPR repeats
MSTTYSATYHNASGHFYQATIFVSPVTITIRYSDESGRQYDVHWLVKHTSLHRQAMYAELQHRHQQTEKLVIRDEALLQAIQKQVQGKHLFNSAGAKLTMAGGILVTLFLAAYLWLFPWMGEKAAMGFSKEEEIKLGRQMYQYMAPNLAADPKKTAVLNTFFRELHFKIDYPIQITVVKSAEMNAFAIPGGHIVVYDAILQKMKSPEELAALLAHESSHVALRHSLRNVYRNLARKSFLLLLFGGDSGMLSAVINQADELKGLAYSRALETEADNNGLQLMAKSQINPRGMLHLMQMMQKESKGPDIPPILSTHPVFDTRISNIKQQIAVLPETRTANPELAKLFRAIYE